MCQNVDGRSEPIKGAEPCRLAWPPLRAGRQVLHPRPGKFGLGRWIRPRCSFVRRSVSVMPAACLAALALLSSGAAGAAPAAAAQYDVLVYGSTPSGIIAAVAAARHGAKTALM